MIHKTGSLVKVVLDGTEYHGEYSIDKGMLTVSTSMYGEDTTQLGQTPPETLAEMILKELVRKSKSSMGK